MEENKNLTEEQVSRNKMEEKAALEEAKRVKVLSPNQLVVKRFLRNRLAIVGLAILVFMFVFAFIGMLFSPYSYSRVFKKTSSIKKDYATAVYNKDYRYTVADGEELSETAKAMFMMALVSGDTSFTDGDTAYQYDEEATGLYRIVVLEHKASTSNRGGSSVELVDDSFEVSAGLKSAFLAAVKSGETSFKVEGTKYYVQKDAKSTYLCTAKPIAVASKDVFDTVDDSYADLMKNMNFRLTANIAVANQEQSFDYDNKTYTLDIATTTDSSTGKNTYNGDILLDGTAIISVSNVVISPKTNDVTLSAAFKEATRQAIAEGKSTFDYTVTDADGTETEYFASTVNGNIYITSYKESELINTFAKPSSKHWLGTDNNGMDLMTRLMFGGRISLLVGFIVIAIELVLGIIIGGLSGFFGGWVDMVLMRFVDLFNSIPYWPMLIIAGSVMDALELNSILRLFSLMFILGFLSWTGIARIVRGQILTLREQEFMIACEANGIRTSRRIFKHLVPNVAPLLIVQATMGLGDVIITEATLSFLGLGVKYPMASWGSIINSATDMFVMTNYWWMWIPAGTCILLTVLGFNFVGDGLRDAFDPKMKR